jgi:hypothetical protein
MCAAVAIVVSALMAATGPAHAAQSTALTVASRQAVETAGAAAKNSPARGGQVPMGVLPKPVKSGAQRPAAASCSPCPAVQTGNCSKCPTNSALFYRGGGPVNNVGVIRGSPRVYIVYWGSQWGAATIQSNGDYTFPINIDSAGMAAVQQDFFRGLGSSSDSWSGVMTQYCDGVSSGATSCPATNTQHVGYPAAGALAGVWYDNSAAAPKAATGTQLAAEVIAAADHFGNNFNGFSNQDNQYVITSPPGTDPVNVVSDGDCSWHSWTTPTAWSGDEIAYTNMPYLPGDSGCVPPSGKITPRGAVLDGVTMVSGHEYAETLTDAFGGDGWTGTNGLVDENADKCNWGQFNNAPNGTVALSTGTFAVMSSWANDGGGNGKCELSHPIVTNPSQQAIPDANLDAMWNNYGDNAICSQWSGGDATNSVQLPDGERAWFFSDTFLNSPAARKSIWFYSAIHNSIVMQNGTSNLTNTITGGNTCQEANNNASFWNRYALTPAAAPDAATDGGFFWTGDQMAVGSNVVKFYYHGHATSNGFALDYPAYAVLPDSSLESNLVMNVNPTQFSCGGSGIIWGTSLLSWGGSVYVYGWQLNTGARSTSIPYDNLYLAKTTAGGLTNPGSWQLLTGLSGTTPTWGSCSAAAVPLAMTDASGVSVTSVNGTLWDIQFDYTNGQLSETGAIGGHPASTPWGFTNNTVKLYDPPTDSAPSYPFYYQEYEPRIEPGLGASADVVISYNVNTTSVDTGCVSANIHDADIYRPRFVDVPVSDFNASVASPAPGTSAARKATAPARTATPDVAGLPFGIHHVPVPFAAGHLPTSARPAPARSTSVKPTAASAPAGASAATGGIDGSTDWFNSLGVPCPSISAPQALSASAAPDGSVPLSWPSVGTDVWYYVYVCDKTVNTCPAPPPSPQGGAPASPWISAFPGPLWVTAPSATIQPITVTGTGGANTSGHTFAIYVSSFGAANSQPQQSSPEISLQAIVQPPLEPTGFTIVTPPGPAPGSTTYTMSWNQVTWPSAANYYTVLYCDFTVGGCTNAISTWFGAQPQLGTTDQLTFPSGDTVGFCVRAENLGGTSPCSNEVTETGT